MVAVHPIAVGPGIHPAILAEDIPDIVHLSEALDLPASPRAASCVSGDSDRRRPGHAYEQQRG